MYKSIWHNTNKHYFEVLFKVTSIYEIQNFHGAPFQSHDYIIFFFLFCFSLKKKGRRVGQVTPIQQLIFVVIPLAYIQFYTSQIFITITILLQCIVNMLFFFFFTTLDVCLYIPVISVLGSDSGYRSMMNKCKQCTQVAITPWEFFTPEPFVSASEYRTFYISWAGKTFSAKKI